MEDSLNGAIDADSVLIVEFKHADFFLREEGGWKVFGDLGSNLERCLLLSLFLGYRVANGCVRVLKFAFFLHTLRRLHWACVGLYDDFLTLIVCYRVNVLLVE